MPFRNLCMTISPLGGIWEDGIFKIGSRFVKSFKFSDINYLVASREDKESMFLGYSELLNSLDSSAVTKLTINNHKLNRVDFENNILMPECSDELTEYRKEYNAILMDKATQANGIVQEKYITISVVKKDIAEAREYGGGYHANTKMGCLSIMVVGWFIGVFALERVISIHWSVGVGVAVIFTVLVFIFTPVLNVKHPVSGDVYKRSKKIVRMFCLFIDVLLLVYVFANIQVVYNAVSVTMMLYCISLLGTKLKV